jgi:hypothetical protein
VPRRASVDLAILSYASMQRESSRGALVGTMSGSSLRCSGCGFENAPGIKFCGECGCRLTVSSSAQPDPRSYTPKHLAEKILTSRAALEVGEKIGSAYISVLAHSMLGAAHVLRGEAGEGASVLERGRALAKERGAGLRWEAHLLTHLADARLHLGETGRARTLVEEAIAAALRDHLGLFEPLARIALARVVLRAEGVAGRTAIETALAQAQSLVAETEARSYEPFIHLELAALARLDGDEARRRRELFDAQRLFTEMGAPLRAEQVAREREA